MSEPRLNNHDQRLLRGDLGEGTALAMRALLRLGAMHNAQRFIDARSAHVATAHDNTRVNLDFAQKLSKMGARVAIPTTLTTCSLDARSIDADSASRQYALIELHRAMGCTAALTCAPYLGYADIRTGDVLAWCESSAIVYANSVVGARCNRFPEFLDLCAALTGRVPEYGLYLEKHRRASMLVQLEHIPKEWFGDPWFFETLGLLVGRQCASGIPAISGLAPDILDRNLCAMGAAMAAAGAVDMFHAIGITPEAPDLETAFGGAPPAPSLNVRAEDIREAAATLNHHTGQPISAFCLGAPHAWAEDGQRLLKLLDGRTVHHDVQCYLTTNHVVVESLRKGGELAQLEQAGVRLVTGRCSYYAPVLPGCGGHVVTPSAKWAWYARNQLGCDVSFMRLEDAVEVACKGSLP